MRVPIRLLIACLLVVGAPTLGFADADARYKQGLAYKQQGKVDDAIASFEKAVAANPRHGMAWASLGHLYKQKGADTGKIVNAYENATAVIKKDKTLWGNLGMAYYRNKQPEKAIEALMVACRLDPKDAEIRGNLGTIRRQQGDIKGAILDLQMATKYKPNEPNYWNNLGVAYRVGKRDKDAVAAFKKAIELSPNDPGFWFNLAVAYRRMRTENPDLITEAIAAYEKATQLDPTNAEGWFDLGFMYKDDHQNDKAVFAFCKYLEVNKGKDAQGQSRIDDEAKALGGNCGGKTPAKKTAPKKKKK